MPFTLIFELLPYFDRLDYTTFMMQTNFTSVLLVYFTCMALFLE